MNVNNKALIVLLGILFLCFPLFAQKVVLSPTQVKKAFYRDESKPLRDMKPQAPNAERKSWPKGEVKNNFERRKHVKSAASSSLTGQTVQDFMGTKSMQQSFIQNFDGMSKMDAGNLTPPDPSGDVGDEYYVQMLNIAFQIFDKGGTSVYGPAANSTIFDGWDDGQPWDNTNDGDPIVLYDDQADRWILTHFSIPTWSGPYYILIAYSTSSDPLGSYYRYAFEFNNFPDYPKFAIWPDGLYLTLNSNTNNAAVFQRDSMLVGGDASMISFSIPDYPGSSFRSALAADCDGQFPPLGTPNYILYYNDDSWGQYPNDHLRIWEFQTDWLNTGNSSLTLQSTLLTEPFDSNFGFGWNNIDQPNNQKLDAIAQAMMFRTQYRRFSGYETMVCNYVVDVDGNDHAGIRWYELRKDSASTAGWYIYQQGTYAPDDEHRWMGAISMDKHGNIGLAYSVSSNNVYPSLRMTGHTAGAPLGVMNITETEIVAGSGSQFGTLRFGDYAQMSIDPEDDETFWFTSEYIVASGAWESRIAAFRFGAPVLAPIDAGLLSFEGPASSSTLTDQEAVSVKVVNAGTDTLSQIPITLSVNGAIVSQDTINGFLLPQETLVHTFNTLTDMSSMGIYYLSMQVNYPGDTISANDTLMVSVEHTEPAYCDASGSEGQDYISKVKVDDFMRISTNQAYSSFLTDTITMKLGETHNMEVSIGNANSNDEVLVWIDWNQDLDFEEADEAYVLGGGYGPISNSIVVPSTAAPGETRMRIRLHRSNSGPNDTPCGTSLYGEVEDYTVHVSDPLEFEIINVADLKTQVYPNPVNNTAQLSFHGIGLPIQIQLINADGKQVWRNETEGNRTENIISINMEAFPAGLYFVRLRLSNSTIIDAQKLVKI